MGRGEKVILENCVVEDTLVFASGENAGGMIGSASQVSLLSCFQLGASGNASSQVVTSNSGGAGGLIGVALDVLKVSKSGVEGGRMETREKEGCGGGIVGKSLTGELFFSQTYVTERCSVFSTNSGGFGGCLEGEGSLNMEHCFSLANLQEQEGSGKAIGVFGMSGNHSISSCKFTQTNFSIFFLSFLDSLSFFSSKKASLQVTQVKKKEKKEG